MPIDEDGVRAPLTEDIDHIGVAVKDGAAVAAELAQRFGCQVETVSDLADGSARLTYLRIGRSTIQLVEPLKAGPIADYIAEHGEGLHHICLVVDSLDRALARMDGENDTIERAYVGGRGCRVVFTNRRIAGVLIELSETSK